MTYYIYIITCLANGKRYVGKTNNPRHRLRGHWAATSNSPISNAFRKHGRDGMRMDLIACARTEADAFDAERALIVQHETRVPHGYNLTEGGEGASGHIPGPEARARMSAAGKGRPKSDLMRQRLSAARKGVKQSPQHRANSAASRRGKPNPSARDMLDKARHLAATPEARAKIKAALTGKKRSPESIVRISSSRAKWASENPDFYAGLRKIVGDRMRGGKQTPEQVAKRVASRRATILARAHGDALVVDQMRAL